MRLGKVKDDHELLVDLTDAFHKDFGKIAVNAKDADSLLAMVTAVYKAFLEMTDPLLAFLRCESGHSLRSLWLGEVEFSGLCRHEGFFLEFDRCPKTRRLRFTTCGMDTFTHLDAAVLH